MGKYNKVAAGFIIISVLISCMLSCKQLVLKAKFNGTREVTVEKREYSVGINITGNDSYTDEEIRYIMNPDSFTVISLKKDINTKGSSFLCTLIPKDEQDWNLNLQNLQVNYFFILPFSKMLSASWDDHADKDNLRLIINPKEVNFSVGDNNEKNMMLRFVELYGETTVPDNFSVKGNHLHKLLCAIKKLSEQSKSEIPVTNFYLHAEHPAGNNLFTFNQNDIIEINSNDVDIRLDPYKIGIRIPGSIDIKELDSKCPDFSSKKRTVKNEIIVEISEIPKKSDNGAYKLVCCDGELALKKERTIISNTDIYFLLDCITTKSRLYDIVFKFYEMPFMAQNRQQIYLPPNLHLYDDRGNLLSLNKDTMNYSLSVRRKYNKYDIKLFNESAKGYYCTGNDNLKITYDSFKEDKNSQTIEINYSLRNTLKRVFFVYYPLQYSTSYRSKIIDNNSELAFKTDAALRRFITHIHKKEIYDDIYIRLVSDKIMSISQTGITGLNEFLFLDRDIYDAPEYLWSEDLLINDYKNKNMHQTTAYVDILYFGSIPSTSRIKDKFKDLKNASIYFINFIDKDRADKIKEKELAKLEILHHAPVAVHLPTSIEKFGNVFIKAFDQNKIEKFFSTNR